MKKIGTTEEGGILVEMTSSEAHEFAQLSSAVGGGDGWADHLRMGNFTEFDASTVFGVIRTWYTTKFQLGNMKRLIADLEKAVNKVEK